MNQHVVRWLAIISLTCAVGAAPVRTEAGPSSDNLLELATKAGPFVGLGFGVSPLHWDPIAPPESVAGAAESRLLGDREPRGRAVSFDLKLRWPTADLPIEPYLVLGPALFVDQPQDLSMTAVPGDPVVRLGAKAGAGFNWRLGKDATLFGSYDVTTTTESFASRGAKAPTTGTPGYDLLYGVRFRY
jgi:hypothetical protein